MSKLLLLPLALLLAAGCNAAPQKNVQESGQDGFKTYTVANYTFEYPSNWQDRDCTQQHAVDSEPFTIPDCALFSPKDVATGPIVATVKAKQTIDQAIEFDGYFPNGFDREELTIDGHRAVYIKTKAPTYTYIDNIYYIEDGDSVIEFTFREYEVSHPEGAPELITDSREYLDDFHRMVKSVKFN
jgi:hypothetical protein